jgi:arylsulfatase A-like enzyme
MPLAAYDDFLYVAALALLFLGLLWLSPGHPRLVYRVFLGVALFSLTLAFANRQIVGWLGRPLTYQWLYYSDFLRSQEARNAILAELSLRQVSITAAGLAVLLALTWALERGFGWLVGRFGLRRFGFAVLLAALGYFSLGAARLSRMGWNPHKLANPVVFFARSAMAEQPSAPLLSRRTSVGTEDFEPRKPTGPRSTISARAGGRVRNVVFFVLESVAAQYTGPYGAAYGATPFLDSALDRAAVFTSAYAHCPTTPSSLASLLLSVYPALSYQSLTQEHPEVRFPSLVSELERRGYRTAFFSSADSRFQKGDVFLAHRGFQRVQDYRSMGCDGPVLHASSTRFAFLDGMDDLCAVGAFRSWLPESPGEPFFAVIWTMMTHHPYFAAGAERDFGVPDTAFNRYLNGLHRGDEALGRLLQALEERGLSESTLVVVFGDHGETFGQHHQRGHGLKIYEENLHVPLVLICPGLFHGERVPTVGGLIDIAPTALDVLGFDPPPAWQGRSLFRSDRTGRVYFYSPFSDNLFGVRDGNRKVIYSGSYDRTELYDLAADPRETVDRAAEFPDAVRLGQERLAAWAQFQERFVRGLVEGGTR